MSQSMDELESGLNYVLEFEKFIDSSKPKDFRIVLNKFDDFSEIRDQTSYTGDIVRVVGEPNPPPDWQKKLRAKREAIHMMDKRINKSADLSTHKLLKRVNKRRIEVLMPERTRGFGRREPMKAKTLEITEQIENKALFGDNVNN